MTARFKKYIMRVLVDYQDDSEYSINDRVCLEQEGDKNKKEDDSSGNEDIVSPQRRNNFYGSDYQSYNNTHETNQDENKFCVVYSKTSWLMIAMQCHRKNN